MSVTAIRIVVAVVALLASTAAAHAQPRAPKLRVRAVADGSVRVSWAGVRTPRGALTVVELERGTAADVTAPLATLPPRPRKYHDVPPSPGSYWYRARAITDTAVGPWSIAVPISLDAAATPAPVPTATPTPVPAGNDPPLAAGQRECRAGIFEDTLALVNQARADANAPALREDARLRWVARSRAIEIARTQQLDHSGWTQTLLAAGYRVVNAAENIANGYFSPQAVVQAWLGSSGHRTNMLSSAYRDTGIGCVIDHNGKLWWAEAFAS